MRQRSDPDKRAELQRLLDEVERLTQEQGAIDLRDAAALDRWGRRIELLRDQIALLERLSEERGDRAVPSRGARRRADQADASAREWQMALWRTMQDQNVQLSEK